MTTLTNEQVQSFTPKTYSLLDMTNMVYCIVDHVFYITEYPVTEDSIWFQCEEQYEELLHYVKYCINNKLDINEHSINVLHKKDVTYYHDYNEDYVKVFDTWLFLYCDDEDTDITHPVYRIYRHQNHMQSMYDKRCEQWFKNKITELEKIYLCEGEQVLCEHIEFGYWGIFPSSKGDCIGDVIEDCWRILQVNRK